MYKLFQVIHEYGTDGGFGDYIPVSDVIATFVAERDADAFVERFAKPHVYDKPYASLDCGTLVIKEIPVYGTGKCNLDEVDTSTFWWLTNEVLD